MCPEASDAYRLLAGSLAASGDFKRAGEQYIQAMEKKTGAGDVFDCEKAWARAAWNAWICFVNLDVHERPADWFPNSKEFRSIADRAHAAYHDEPTIWAMRAEAYNKQPIIPADLHQAAADWRRCVQLSRASPETYLSGVSKDGENARMLRMAHEAEERAISWAIEWIG